MRSNYNTYHSTITSPRACYFIEILYPAPNGRERTDKEVSLLAEEPAVLTYSSEDKITPLVGSSLELNLYSREDGEFLHLLQSPEGSVRVLLWFKGKGGAEPRGELIWQGVLDGEDYQEPYNVHKGYPTRLRFTDFGYLKRVRHTISQDCTVSEAVEQLCAPIWFVPRHITFGSEPDLQGREREDGRKPTLWSYHNMEMSRSILFEEDGKTPLFAYEALQRILVSLSFRLEQRMGYLRLYDLSSLIGRSHIKLKSAGSDAVLMGDRVYTEAVATLDPLTSTTLEAELPKLKRRQWSFVEKRQELNAINGTYWAFDRLGTTDSLLLEISPGTIDYSERAIALFFDGAVTGGFLVESTRNGSILHKIFINSVQNYSGGSSSSSLRGRGILWGEVQPKMEYGNRIDVDIHKQFRNAALLGRPRITDPSIIKRMLSGKPTHRILSLEQVAKGAGPTLVSLDALVLLGSHTYQAKDDFSIEPINFENGARHPSNKYVYLNTQKADDVYKFNELKVFLQIVFRHSDGSTSLYNPSGFRERRGIETMSDGYVSITYRDVTLNKWVSPKESVMVGKRPRGLEPFEYVDVDFGGAGLEIKDIPASVVSIDVHVMDAVRLNYKENYYTTDAREFMDRGEIYPNAILIKNLKVTFQGERNDQRYSEDKLRVTAKIPEYLDYRGSWEKNTNVETYQQEVFLSMDSNVESASPTRLKTSGCPLTEVVRSKYPRNIYGFKGGLLERVTANILEQYGTRGFILEGTFEPRFGLYPFVYFGKRYIRLSEDIDLRGDTSRMTLAELKAPFAYTEQQAKETERYLDGTGAYIGDIVEQPYIVFEHNRPIEQAGQYTSESFDDLEDLISGYYRPFAPSEEESSDLAQEQTYYTQSKKIQQR